MPSSSRNILVTGGAGFIGKDAVEELLKASHDVTVLDSLTYAVDSEFAKAWNEKMQRNFPGRILFINEDIANFSLLPKDSGAQFTPDAIRNLRVGDTTFDGVEFLENYKINWIVHLAAETAEPRSRSDPQIFATTNQRGSVDLITSAYVRWTTMISEWHTLPEGKEKDELAEQIRNSRFLCISTDKTVGAVAPGAAKHTEEDPYKPASFYAETKKASEQFGLALFQTTDPETLRKSQNLYESGWGFREMLRDLPFSGFPFIIVRLENVIGRNQHPEKMLPGIIQKVLKSMEQEEIREDDKPYTVFGPEIIHSYMNKQDVCQGIIQALEFGRPGQIYHLGGYCELTNLRAIQIIADTFQELSLENPPVVPRRRDGRDHNDKSLFHIGPPREGDDAREALDARKAEKELGYRPQYVGEEGFRRGVREVIIDSAVRWQAQHQAQLDAALTQVDLTAIRNAGASLTFAPDNRPGNRHRPR